MDFCQESETVVENNENKNTQGAEETALTLSCPDERSERNHVCCLLGVSDLTLEEDERAIEFAIGTGWEEAVSVFLGLSYLGLCCKSFSKVVYVTRNVGVNIGALGQKGSGVTAVCARGHTWGRQLYKDS